MNELYHFGIKGMKWGVRRYRNEDGTLTPAGSKRYAKDHNKSKSEKKTRNKVTKKQRVKNIRRTQRVAIAAKMSAIVLNAIGQSQYNKYKDNATPGRVKVVNGMAYTAKALDAIGSIAVTSSAIQRYQYARHYWDWL